MPSFVFFLKQLVVAALFCFEVSHIRLKLDFDFACGCIYTHIDVYNFCVRCGYNFIIKWQCSRARVLN